MLMTNTAVNTMPAMMKCSGRPWAKSLVRFLLDWTPKAAARVLPITWASDSVSRLGFSSTSGSIAKGQTRGRGLLKVKIVSALLCLCLAGCISAQNRPLQLISGGGPAYPAEARERGLEGYVVVRYDVTAAGGVSNAQVVEAQPADIFDAAALVAVRSWVFQPALVAGEPQAQQGLHSTVRFKLGSGAEYAEY